MKALLFKCFGKVSTTSIPEVLQGFEAFYEVSDKGFLAF
jgi:hypothetical protein